jgi:hypothetical protein
MVRWEAHKRFLWFNPSSEYVLVGKVQRLVSTFLP